MAEPFVCRLCPAACGLRVTTAGGQVTRFDGDPDDPVGAGHVCARPAAALAAPRILQPHKREGDALVPISWEAARAELRRLWAPHRGQPARTGFWIGPVTEQDPRSLARALALAAAAGTPNVFSPWVDAAGPRVRAIERMVGQPAHLQSDLGRAHVVIVLGGGQPESDWGPGLAGMGHAAAIQFSRKTKGTRLIVAGPRRTAWAAGADQYLPLRPGTEPFFLLGLLSAVVKGGWRDVQFVDDYTTGWPELVDTLAPWPVERCAAVCGLDAATLSGIALKFSRAAMAVVHPDAESFANAHGGFGAWAWATLHAVTANALRPGGLFDPLPLVDPQPLLAFVGTGEAPRTTAGARSLLLGRASSAALAESLAATGDEALKALLVLDGDPVPTLPGGAAALGSLDALVVVGSAWSEAARRAHLVLPVAAPWEEPSTDLGLGPSLPARVLRMAPAVVPPPEGVPTRAALFAELAGPLGTAWRGGAWGRHVQVGAALALRADLDAWLRTALGLVLDESDAAALDSPAVVLRRGEIDRSAWRVAHPNNKLELLPAAVATVLRALEPPEEPAGAPARLWLRAVGPGESVGVAVAPGLPAGAVCLRSAGGSVVVDAVVDDTLAPGTVWVRDDGRLGAGVLVPVGHLDPLDDATPLCGQPLSVEPVEPGRAAR